MNIHDLIRELREDEPDQNRAPGGRRPGRPAAGAGRQNRAGIGPHANLDALVREGVCGLSIPVLPGITPGSGPGHLGLFGYDPLNIASAAAFSKRSASTFEVGPRDVAVRGNFCTVDGKGIITDRRAGRPTTERCVAMCRKLLQTMRVPGVELFVEPVREHRFVVVFRGDDLGDAVNDTDPQQVGHAAAAGQGRRCRVRRRRPTPSTSFVAEAGRGAQGRGADQHGDAARLRALSEDRRPCRKSTACKPAAIAVYPMYKGLARLVGMDVARRRLDAGRPGRDAARSSGAKYDFFFLHYKYTDSTGEDGNFAAKVEMIERFDAEIPKVRALNPDVLIVTGDHSTPSKLKSHSWHPVPTVLWAKTCRTDAVTEFGESQCLRGGLGQFQAMYLLPLAMAHARRLGKYGA